MTLELKAVVELGPTFAGGHYLYTLQIKSEPISIYRLCLPVVLTVHLDPTYYTVFTTSVQYNETDKLLYLHTQHIQTDIFYYSKETKRLENRLTDTTRSVRPHYE